MSATAGSDRGRFITIEGQDGAGKSTNTRVIENFLTEQGIRFVNTREPGGTRFGESIRELLLNDSDDSIGDVAELLLMFAARAQHIQEVIEPALARGDWVLCDRFTDATYAYQGGGRELGMEAVATLEQLVQGVLRPDLTLLLDLPVALGESRAGSRSDPDRFELQQNGFKQKVRETYLRLAEAQPERIKVIDASKSFDEVEATIRAVLREFVAS